MNTLRNLLREYVALLEVTDEEAEKKLRLRAEKTKLSGIEKLLLKHGIIPIVRDKKIKYLKNDIATSFLGKGEYSEVYEVSYHGKHAVAKVTSVEGDIVAMQRLSDLRDEFEPKLARHLPIVYEVIKDGTTYIAVVERLVPLEPHIKSMLFTTAFDYKDKRFMSQVIPMLKNKEYIRNTIKDKVRYSFSMLNPDTRIKIIDTVTKFITETDYGVSYDVDKIKKKVKTVFDVLTYTIADIIADNETEQFSPTFVQSMITQLKSIVLSLIEENVFPESYEKSGRTQLSRNFPGVESLIKLLEELRRKKNISWEDLHFENIMQRPGTGDIVISDPGLFSFGPGDDDDF